MNLYDELLRQIERTIELRSDKPDETFESTLRSLWWTAAGWPRSPIWASVGPLPTLSESQTDEARALVQRRLSGVPLCYLTRRQRFLGLEMHAAPGALIPRKETEVLGRAALSLIRDRIERHGTARIVDVCTGSGNLALAYASHQPRARVHAADLSADAIRVAEINASMMGLAGAVDFRVGDLAAPFAELAGQVDVLSCNPPYISTGKLRALPAEIADHEPALAFDGGPFGINILRRLTTEGAAMVRPGGWMCLEVGLGQGPAVAQRLSACGLYGDIRTYADGQGAIRALAAQVREQ